MGVGRVGSAIGPYLAGWMFSSGLPRGEVSLMFASLVLVAGIILATSKRRETGVGHLGVTPSSGGTLGHNQLY